MIQLISCTEFVIPSLNDVLIEREDTAECVTLIMNIIKFIKLMMHWEFAVVAHKYPKIPGILSATQCFTFEQ